MTVQVIFNGETMEFRNEHRWLKEYTSHPDKYRPPFKHSELQLNGQQKVTNYVNNFGDQMTIIDVGDNYAEEKVFENE